MVSLVPIDRVNLLGWFSVIRRNVSFCKCPTDLFPHFKIVS